MVSPKESVNHGCKITVTPEGGVNVEGTPKQLRDLLLDVQREVLQKHRDRKPDLSWIKVE